MFFMLWQRTKTRKTMAFALWPGHQGHSAVHFLRFKREVVEFDTRTASGMNKALHSGLGPTYLCNQAKMLCFSVSKRNDTIQFLP